MLYPEDDAFENAKVRDEIDERLGFKRWEHGTPKTGWLVNMHAVSAPCGLSDRFALLIYRALPSQTLLRDDDTPGGKAAVDYYFIEEDGSSL